MRGAPLVAAALVGSLLLGLSACTEDGPDRPSDDGRSDRSGERRGGATHGDDRSPSTAPLSEPPSEPVPSAPPVTTRFESARTARELADRLVVAEDLARTAGADVDVRSAAAFETQLLYRQLARTPSWTPRVRAAVPSRYRDDVDLHLTARHSLRSVITTLSDELPAWEIAPPAPTADLLRFYREGERVHGVAWELLAAINLVETGFGKIRGLSSAGAQGPMQFIPATWAAYGEGDVTDPHDAILGAANYLAANGGDTGTTSGPGVENALYRYNNHPGYVDGIRSYATILERDPRALDVLVRWQIIYLSTIGDVWLPVGYRENRPIPVRAYVREHPERRLSTVTD